MLKPLCLVASLALGAQLALAQPVGEASGGVVSAKNGDALAVKVPKGWILDNRAGVKDGIDMLFYPADVKFRGFGKNTPVFAYVMPTVRGKEKTRVKDLIDRAVHDMRQSDRSVSLKVEMTPQPDPNNISTVTIVKYTMPSLPRFERVAYLEDDRTIYAMVLSANSEAELAKRSDFLKEAIENHRRFIGAEKK